jgi:hypothetical protein
LAQHQSRESTPDLNPSTVLKSWWITIKITCCAVELNSIPQGMLWGLDFYKNQAILVNVIGNSLKQQAKKRVLQF